MKETTEMKLRIEQDNDPESPRTWDNLGTMVCQHRHYNLGDVQGFAEDVPEGALTLPLYLYDHSGITMRATPFSCPWDSGQVGVIYVTQERIIKEYGSITTGNLEKAAACLKGEVETYDQFLTGDVWGYIIEDDDGEQVDSCWGFFGREDCEQDGNAALQCAIEHAAKLADETALAECMP